MRNNEYRLLNPIISSLILLLIFALPSAVNAACDGDYTATKSAQATYPSRAQRRGIEGYAVVQFTITVDGKIENLQIVESEPKGVFDRSAIKAASNHQFDPCIENGQAVEITDKKLKFTFKLE